MLNVAIIIGSTRPNRLGEPIAKWAETHAKAVVGWKVELVDLRDWPLPFFQEKASLMYLNGDYSIDLAKEWSKKIASFDAFIIVAPEYNHGPSAVLKNALDYLYAEWNNKPVAFVAYGSVGGARAVEQLRQVAGELQMADIREAVHIVNPWMLVKDEQFAAEEHHDKKMEALAAQLDWWAKALKAARTSS